MVQITILPADESSTSQPPVCLKLNFTEFSRLYIIRAYTIKGDCKTVHDVGTGNPEYDGGVVVLDRYLLDALEVFPPVVKGSHRLLGPDTAFCYTVKSYNLRAFREF